MSPPHGSLAQRVSREPGVRSDFSRPGRPRRPRRRAAGALERGGGEKGRARVTLVDGVEPGAMKPSAASPDCWRLGGEAHPPHTPIAVGKEAERATASPFGGLAPLAAAAPRAGGGLLALRRPR
jgi:hypothetical protein